MNNKHYVFSIGTRAQMIKVAPVVAEFEKRGLACSILLTGQHKETMEGLINEFHLLSPCLNATSSSERSSIISLVLWAPKAYLGCKKILSEIKNCEIEVFVHGDTLSTAISALAAKKSKCKVIHLESGLTSGHILDPFPEELFRRFVFHFTDIAMCPGSEELKHMQKYKNCIALNTYGNTILDSIKKSGAIKTVIESKSNNIIVSLHRFQNIYPSKRFFYLIDFIEKISENYEVFFILHPITLKKLEKTKIINRLKEKIKLLPRMGYKEFINLAAAAQCVITDGGSNQEELNVLGVPTLIMRSRTERKDGLSSSAIMEGELNCSPEEFLLSEKHKLLKKEPLKLDEVGPSYRIADLCEGKTGF